MKGLATAFLKWQEEQLRLEATGKQTTWQMYRRKLKILNRNKPIVFIGSHFGIFPSHEVFMLANVPVLEAEKGLNINRDQICAKYTAVPLTEKPRPGVENFLQDRSILFNLYIGIPALKKEREV